MSTAHVGCSGFQYRNWRGRFYPEPTPQRLWLEYYAERMNSVEINASFYRTPTAATCRAWRQRTPAGFSFVLKGARSVTHTRRMNENSYSEADRFAEAMEGLGSKLICVLWQLPPSFHMTAENRDRVLTFSRRTSNRFPAAAFEFRHSSWRDQSLARELAANGHEYVRSDHGHFNCMEITSECPLSYVRMHGPNGDCRGSYSQTRLETAAAILADRPVALSYFNNDIDVGAPFDAQRLSHLLRNTTCTG